MTSEASQATTPDSITGKPKRRPHSNLKSRNGCAQCKKRKVKCDEAPGSCGACVRRGDRCSLKPSTPPPSPYQPDLVPVSGLLDLKLLHNFSTKTASTLTNHETLRQFYRVNFLDEVLKYDYLLHCVLAFSAFHIVEQQEELLKAIPSEHSYEIESQLEEYLAAAHTHFNASIRSFRRTLTGITIENCHALLVCSSYLFVTSMAESAYSLRRNSARSSSPRPCHISDFLKWLPLLRGTKAVALTGDIVTQVKTGPMASIFTNDDFVGLTCRGRWEENFIYLDKLVEAFQERSEATVLVICLPAVEMLREQMRKKHAEPESAAAFHWALEVDCIFIELLEAQASEALLVFASYCVLLHSQNWRWWIKDWPANTVRMIEPMLSERWRGMLDWPLKVTEDRSGELSRIT
ncbi:hypothetical protein Vi05172_g1785 [Venturia inaequalis]|uniref:Zn(2)-C6 fungal-type domain-containing protein n=1 Tax=Venturia inaequalis TaxID=5025 RepID=A0A8H3U789_VENIN|nr:hypothetical protein EG327_000608 [Venturia inaequalis]RDI88288.1 hypothetical protein Vi05172_g1785 [Venturia inaequalis]